MVARFGTNKNGAKPGWRCYGQFEPTATEGGDSKRTVTVESLLDCILKIFLTRQLEMINFLSPFEAACIDNQGRMTNEGCQDPKFGDHCDNS